MENDVCVKDKKGNLQFYSPSGEKVRVKYIWNETRDGLVEHERIDIVKEMNERAKGMTIPEQIARLDRGDTSVIDPSRITPEDFSTDVSGMPESCAEIIDQATQAKAAIIELKEREAAEAKLKADYKALQDEIIKKKAEYDAAVKAFDDKKAAEKEGDK